MPFLSFLIILQKKLLALAKHCKKYVLPFSCASYLLPVMPMFSSTFHVQVATPS
jgi:hypothetical protein